MELQTNDLLKMHSVHDASIIISESDSLALVSIYEDCLEGVSGHNRFTLKSRMDSYYLSALCYKELRKRGELHLLKHNVA